MLCRYPSVSSHMWLPRPAEMSPSQLTTCILCEFCLAFSVGALSRHRRIFAQARSFYDITPLTGHFWPKTAESVTPQRLLLEVPSIGSPTNPSTPAACSEEHRPRPVRANEQVTFRPRGLSPPRRFSPDWRRRHYCSLLPILGFITFCTRCRLHEPALERADSPARPRDSPRCVHPSKNSPSIALLRSLPRSEERDITRTCRPPCRCLRWRRC